MKYFNTHETLMTICACIYVFHIMFVSSVKVSHNEWALNNYTSVIQNIFKCPSNTMYLYNNLSK